MPVKQHTLPRVPRDDAEVLPEFDAVMASLGHEELPDFTTEEFSPFMQEVEAIAEKEADARAAEIEAQVLRDEKDAVRDDWSFDADVDLPGDYELSWKQTIKVSSVRADRPEADQE